MDVDSPFSIPYSKGLDSNAGCGIMRGMNSKEELIEQLDSFDLSERKQALGTLLAEYGTGLPAGGTNVNMHLHSFFSYNAEGFSPSHLVWACREAGLYAAGLCDFDVLDGLEEFLAAGRTVGLRTSVNLETRAFIREFADVDISSPGEPGVGYVMGAGFAARISGDGEQGIGLAGYRERAKERNLALIERINPNIPDIAIDYEQDVLPLTPAGVATERHIIRAYTDKAQDVFEHAAEITKFWSQVLEKDFEETVEVLADRPSLEDDVRNRLAKRGGLGYLQPSESTFPSVDDFLKWVASCDAIPMATWLDGTSAGEKDGRAMLECMCSKGAAALNIIPDRNWNLSDPEQRAVKMANLKAIVEIANDMNLPVNIGTEMNKRGLPFVDDLSVDALSPYANTFMKGARIMVGHTNLLRYADFSYIGTAAEAEFATVAEKNDFFEAVGAMQALTEVQAAALEDMGPEKALAWIRDSITG